MNTSASASSSARADRPGIRAIGIALLLGFMLLPGAALAQQVRLGGFVRLDRRFTLADSVRIADFYNVFRPELTASFDGQADVVVSLDMRFNDFTGVRSTDELQQPDRHFPNSLTVWEAFARLSGFLVEPLDLTIGKQRIQWGTADGLNPTDRLNAYDLSDITDFTARLPTWALRAEYWATDAWRVDATWTPTAHGPLLPVGMDGMLTSSGVPGPPGSVTSWQLHFDALPGDFADSQYGFRVAGTVAALDVSLSWFDGSDGVPIAERIRFAVPDTAVQQPAFEAHAWSALPRLRVLGADVATEWRGIGLWGEGAIAFPDDQETVTEVVTPSDSVSGRVDALDGTPYATWTVGGDYTFPGGWYVNLQWAHGIFLEQVADRLHDYLVTRFERGLSRETVSLEVKAAVELPGGSDHPGWGIFPEVVYSPVDNIDVSLGGFFGGGGAGTLFGRWSDAGQAFLRVTASF